jgi:hypothetical protein
VEMMRFHWKCLCDMERHRKSRNAFHLKRGGDGSELEERGPLCEAMNVSV